MINVFITLKRRAFLRSSVVAFGFSLLGCSPSTPKNIEAIVTEAGFHYFLDVLIPAPLKGLQKYKSQLIKRLSRLSAQEAELIVYSYLRFKEAFIQTFTAFDHYSLAQGESILAQLLKGDALFTDADKVNQALDTIYIKFSEIRGVGYYLWGRSYSRAGRRCAYWDNYDQPVAENNNEPVG